MRTLLALALLVGCAPTAQQIAARQAAELQYQQQLAMQAQARAAADRQAIEDACLLRLPEGAVQVIWDACLRDEQRKYEAAENARLQRALDSAIADRQAAALEEQARAANALRWQMVGEQISRSLAPAPQPAPVYVAPQAPPRTLNCTSTSWIPGQVNTTCN